MICRPVSSLLLSCVAKVPSWILAKMLPTEGGPCEAEAEGGDEEAGGDDDTDKFWSWMLMTPFSMLAMPATRALRFMATLSLTTHLERYSQMPSKATCFWSLAMSCHMQSVVTKARRIR